MNVFVSANIDNKEGAIGFVSRLVPSIYPISIIKVDQDSGEPVRDKNGLCVPCEPGNLIKFSQTLRKRATS